MIFHSYVSLPEGIFVGLTQAVPLTSKTTTADGATLPAGESMPGRSGSHSLCVLKNQQNMLESIPKNRPKIWIWTFTKTWIQDNSSINKNICSNQEETMILLATGQVIGCRNTLLEIFPHRPSGWKPSGWWFQPLWKIWVRQWAGLSHILWTIKKKMFETTNQLLVFMNTFWGLDHGSVWFKHLGITWNRQQWSDMSPTCVGQIPAWKSAKSGPITTSVLGQNASNSK